jgi:hypothetical protein
MVNAGWLSRNQREKNFISIASAISPIVIQVTIDLLM